MARAMTHPWTHPLRWAEVARSPQSIRLVAADAERAAIARALDLEGVKRLEADLTVRPWLDGAQIRGRIDAQVVQICGVSLDPFDAEVIDDFEVRVVPAGSPNAGGGEDVLLDPEGEDPPDVVEGDAIDLAAYVVEHLALALDPFPRKPGVAFEPPQDATPESPFAVLKALKLPPEG